MKIPTDDSRFNMRTTATMFSMDPGHFRRLVRRGVLPEAKRTAKSMPYYDGELLHVVVDVLRTGVGCNGEEIAFYRRHAKQSDLLDRREARRTSGSPVNTYVESVIDGCHQLGIEDERLTPVAVSRGLLEEFGVDFDERSLEEVIPVIARRMLSE